MPGVELTLAYVNYPINGIAFVLSVYNLYLIFFVSSKTMKQYRYFLLYYTIFDIIFSFSVGFVFAPEMTFPVLGAIVKGPARYLGSSAGHWMFGFSVFMGSQCVSALDHCVMYRYFLLKNNANLRFFLSSTGFLLHLVIGFGIAGTIGGTLILCGATPEELLQEYIQEGDKESEQMLREIQRSGMTFSGFRLRLVPATICIVAIVFGLVFSITLNGFIFIRIYRALKEVRGKISVTTYKMHSQLCTLLGVQLLYPLLVIGVPVVIFLAAVLANMREGLETRHNQMIIYGAIMTFPLFNAASTIFFVAPYWRFTTSIFMQPARKLASICTLRRTVEHPVVTMPTKISSEARRKASSSLSAWLSR